VPLSDDQVRDLALLARLELSTDELATVRPQLERILDFVRRLGELDTESIEPMTTALDVDNRWRDDTGAAGLTTEQALANAPSHDDETFLVPPVLGPSGAKR